MKMEPNKIYNMDCLEGLQQMDSKSVDLVVTSPPYNMRTRVRNGRYTYREKSEHFSKKYTFFHDALPIEDYYEFHKRVIGECLRVSPLVFWNIQIVTGSKEALFKLIGYYSEYLRDVVIWDKGHGQPAMHEGVLNRCYELIFIFESPAKPGRTFENYEFERGKMNDIWRIKRATAMKGHGARFPLELVENILKGWTKTESIILDPFMGSGTTAVACKQLGRDYIGFELSEEYCKIAEERLRNTEKDLTRYT